MIEKMMKELVNLGSVKVLKDDYVFTLLMMKDGKRLDPLYVMGVVLDHLKGRKPIVEVMRNEDEYILIVLKPKL